MKTLSSFDNIMFPLELQSSVFFPSLAFRCSIKKPPVPQTDLLPVRRLNAFGHLFPSWDDSTRVEHVFLISAVYSGGGFIKAEEFDFKM